MESNRRTRKSAQSRTRRHPIYYVIAIGIIIAFSMIIIVGTATLIGDLMAWRSQSYDYSTTTSYTVAKGDTLWAIAGEYSNEQHDIRMVIDEIQSLSDCTADLRPGQTLTIPLFDVMQEDG